MANVAAKAAKMTMMRIEVTRCTCGAPASHPGTPCPQGVADPSGTRILRSYKNPLRQLVWAITGR
jgi:hypothetical protein